MKSRKNQSSTNMKFLIALPLIIIALISLLIIVNKESQKPGSDMASHPSIENQPTIGEADAPVSIVEFGDFLCPACKSWGEYIYPELKKDYIDKGLVKLSYVNVLFHGEESILASLAAEVVYKNDPQAYWDFHKKLFSEQPVEHVGQWVTIEKILEVAEATTNIDLQQLENDLIEKSTMDEVDIDDKLVKEYKVEMTPSVIINGVMMDNPMDYGEIKKLIEQQLEDN
ncbi:DsbA family protein [Cytobacillus sp. IB215665]|uniref:DsbA family protein n=1 Tax=Cytobacillus sp. IB215665 TaxID=3097357 RepID=UPI002A0BFFCD|nr:DsbA family protein [Cytobacillus sp. IB215665]MDX8366814.1 DsbA family protein [Cytobacillus sp. IB215665]